MNDNALHERAKGAALSGARRFPLPPLALTTLGATAILILTYTGIKRNQSESFEILKSQGVTLLQTLVASADNAITANSYFWDSFVSRVAPVAQSGFTVAGAERVMERFPTNLEGITLTAAYTFDDRLTLLSSSLNPDADFQGQPREVFFEAASELLADSAQFQSLVFLPDSVSGSASAVFLQLDSTRTGGVCLLVDFPGLWEMESRIGIGRLIQRLGAARSVEYIFFQDPDGIVFSSRAIDSALAIGSDPFLSKAFDTDTISSRVYMFGESEALELVAPFSSTPYPDGLFRLGISLDTYNAGKTAFTQQMVLFGAILFLFAILLPLYFGARSERRELGGALARAKSLSDTILDSMRSGVLAIKPNNSIELVNERLREMLEIEEPLLGAGDWRATGLRERLPGDIFENPDSTEGATEFETTINGQNRSFLYSVAEIGAEKEHIGSALVIYDYTRQKELEEEAARRVRLAELGDLAAGVAHEIRNPLNAISLAAQRLDSEFSPEGDSEKSDFSFFTSQIKNETGRLNEIVTRLLGLTRVPKTEAKMADVGAIVEEWARFMEAEFNRDRAHVSLELGENAQARVDADKLRQALGNLYRNSKEAAPDQSPLNVDIQLRREESSLSIVFSDNGPGITTEAVERLFTPYYTTKESGSGLGLSISYRLVTDMGGSLELDKSYTGGARFVITLPTREE